MQEILGTATEAAKGAKEGGIAEAVRTALQKDPHKKDKCFWQAMIMKGDIKTDDQAGDKVDRMDELGDDGRYMKLVSEEGKADLLAWEWCEGDGPTSPEETGADSEEVEQVEDDEKDDKKDGKKHKKDKKDGKKDHKKDHKKDDKKKHEKHGKKHDK
jgi:hypothetical protein